MDLPWERNSTRCISPCGWHCSRGQSHAPSAHEPPPLSPEVYAEGKRRPFCTTRREGRIGCSRVSDSAASAATPNHIYTPAMFGATPEIPDLGSNSGSGCPRFQSRICGPSVAWGIASEFATSSCHRASDDAHYVIRKPYRSASLTFNPSPRSLGVRRVELADSSGHHCGLLRQRDREQQVQILLFKPRKLRVGNFADNRFEDDARSRAVLRGRRGWKESTS